VKLKANCLISLLETTAAVWEAAKLHKFIRQIVFQIFRIYASTRWLELARIYSGVRSKISYKKNQTNFALGYRHLVVFFSATDEALLQHKHVQTTVFDCLCLISLSESTVTETKIFQRYADALKNA